MEENRAKIDKDMNENEEVKENEQKINNNCNCGCDNCGQDGCSEEDCKECDKECDCKKEKLKVKLMQYFHISDFPLFPYRP